MNDEWVVRELPVLMNGFGIKKTLAGAKPKTL